MKPIARENPATLGSTAFRAAYQTTRRLPSPFACATST
jgi:hypothetical protein